MAKKQQNLKSMATLYDSLAATLAFIFTVSIIDNVRNFVTNGVQDSPATWALIGALLLVAYSWYKNKRFTLLANETMAVLVTATAIWGFGLHGWLR